MRKSYPHDEYAAYLGECECQRCCPPEWDGNEPDDDSREGWKVEAMEWGGVDYP